MGTADDIPLRDYTREIQITDLFTDYAPIVVNPNLRQIKVIVKYKVAGVLAHLYADDVHIVILMKNTHRSIGRVRSAHCSRILARRGDGLGGAS